MCYKLCVRSCSNQAIVEHCSDHPCRALLQGPLSSALASTVELCSSALGCRALLLPSDRRAFAPIIPVESLLQGPLSPTPAGTVESCSSALGGRTLSTNQTIVDHCSNHPCRAVFQRPLSLAPAGTVEPCSSALVEKSGVIFRHPKFQLHYGS